MIRPAISTPRPLPREREHAGKRGALGKLHAVPAHNPNGNGLAPAKAIQKDDAPLSRRTTIQKLAEDVALAADIELLDLMRDELGSYSRHKAAQEARTWAGAASIQLETRLMMLDRALRPVSI